MRFLTLKLSPLLIACTVTGLHGAALAGDRDATPGVAVAGQAQAAPAVQADFVPDIGQALDTSALDAMRGGETVIDVSANNNGEVNGNTADGIVSGSNIITGGAFTDVAGINTVIQNSGSNVLIQNGTAVNVQFAAPTP